MEKTKKSEAREIYEFTDYKAFLLSKAGPRQSRLGVRSQIAKVLCCQSTYVSQILYGKAHLSLEQAEALVPYFAFNREEAHFFLLLVQSGRAGTNGLKDYFKDQLEQLRNQRLSLTNRLGQMNVLSKEDQSTYYSSWQYAAVHMACTIPDLQTLSRLQSALKISRKRLLVVCDFLQGVGLIEKSGESLKTTPLQIRLGNQSQHIIKHHSHWQMRAIESLERESLLDLHYSAVVTLSKDDVTRLKNQMLEQIGEWVKQIRVSEEQELYSLNLDFFSVVEREGEGQ